MDEQRSISGNIVDVLNGEIFQGTVFIHGGRIENLVRQSVPDDAYILPGFIDSHIHIESSMLTPSRFARIAAVHGTVAAVSDPHEIANVLGVDGVKYMIEDGRRVPMKFYFGAPSCVPATGFETSGADIGPGEVEELLSLPEVRYLAEVMNFPGVILGDAAVNRKIEIARSRGKVIDGHAPGLRGEDLKIYAGKGITTDHESLSMDEALEKIGLGMKVLIREGSAAKDFDMLVPLIGDHGDACMLCSDDLHPDDLARGHINLLVKKAVLRGFDLMKVLRAACVNPVLHYGLDVGLLQRGDNADFLVVDSLRDFNVLQTWIDGKPVADRGRPLFEETAVTIVNNFSAVETRAEDFAVPAQGDRARVIEARDGQLLTGSLQEIPSVEKGFVIADTGLDILKIAVVNRYRQAPPAVALIRNFGLKKGAIASSIAHDSHNIIAVGTSDENISRAVNLIVRHRGGICAVDGKTELVLPLPVAGLMSADDYASVAGRYTELNEMARRLGTGLTAPFMTLSFMALPVIPELKLTDRGLFDGRRFSFVSLFPES